MMAETVRLGDSFFSLSERMLGDGSRWPEVAQANQLPNPGLLLVDQQVRPPGTVDRISSFSVATLSSGTDLRPAGSSGMSIGSAQGKADPRGTTPALVPAHSYVFVVADEINPLRGKVIRRVITSPKLAVEVARQIGRPVQVFPNPERFGFVASDRPQPFRLVVTRRA